MKYIKLGSKADAFQRHGNIITVDSELPSDAVFIVEGREYHLHKYPLLCKSGYLQLLTSKYNLGNGNSNDQIQIKGIPGGADAFELCAKFCYGITFTLNAYNVVPVRCAAEYLEMTEAMEKGNLIYKLDYFLSSSVFQSWKDSIISLKTMRSLNPWADDLKLSIRCIDFIAAKASVDFTKVDWSFTHTRACTSTKQLTTKQAIQNILQNAGQVLQATVPKDWWVEDVAELDIDLFKKIISAIKSKARVSNECICEALRVYAYKWIPALMSKDAINNPVPTSCGEESVDIMSTHKHILEILVGLLPSEKGSSPCSFLFKLQKAANVLGVAQSLKIELAQRVALQLDEASLNDLLIPSLSYANDSLYDVDTVQCIVEQFMSNEGHSTGSSSPDHMQSPNKQHHNHHSCKVADSCQDQSFHEFGDSQSSCSPIHSSMLKVAKLIDGYLAEIARDANLALSKFIAIAELIPVYARPVHDSLYRAIDIYLKEHGGLTKTEKKRICKLMDCKKLSMDACMHAAQNERLPLRVVVQVLFFEQVRTTMTGGFCLTDDLQSSHMKNSSSMQVQPHIVGMHDHQGRVLPSNGLVGDEDWDDMDAKSQSNVNLKKQGSVKDTASEDSVTACSKQVLKQGGILGHSKKILNKIWSSVSTSSRVTSGSTIENTNTLNDQTAESKLRKK